MYPKAAPGPSVRDQLMDAVGAPPTWYALCFTSLERSEAMSTAGLAGVYAAVPLLLIAPTKTSVTPLATTSS